MNLVCGVNTYFQVIFIIKMVKNQGHVGMTERRNK